MHGDFYKTTLTSSSDIVTIGSEVPIETFAGIPLSAFS